MDKEGVQRRFETKIAAEQIAKAKLNNVTIIRTIDLLMMMKQWEQDLPKARGKKLLEHLSKGGGWLRASEDTVELTDS